MEVMRRPTTAVAAAAVALALAAAGGGAAVAVALSPGSAPAATVVRNVTVAGAAQPVAAVTGSLSVNEIYRRSYRGVVDITITGSGVGGSQQAEGSGFVYDTKGHIVTNQHVVDSAQTI